MWGYLMLFDFNWHKSRIMSFLIRSPFHSDTIIFIFQHNLLPCEYAVVNTNHPRNIIPWRFQLKSQLKTMYHATNLFIYHCISTCIYTNVYIFTQTLRHRQGVTQGIFFSGIALVLNSACSFSWTTYRTVPYQG